ncbi:MULTISPECIES: DUF1573 domain-containing protein [Chryseobacterium]|uniref:DUF1573 domain-containing protein n=1 Tax=Chryseobacterium sp. R2A-55 TaxID=2744445 RepID=UPI001F37C68D|nr:DUF1573 domain-containing protein [Chryseobacterium sp. R2A-55]
MKNIFAALFLTASFAFASAQTISFEKTTVDYGTVKNGADGNRNFVVKNTGDKPLIISRVQPSCGCTVPEWSQDPIMPGKTGQIKVHYNTTLTGHFTKSIEVYSNDPENSRSVVNITGTVEPAATAAAEMKAASADLAVAQKFESVPSQATAAAPARATMKVKKEAKNTAKKEIAK